MLGRADPLARGTTSPTAALGLKTRRGCAWAGRRPFVGQSFFKSMSGAPRTAHQARLSAGILRIAFPDGQGLPIMPLQQAAKQFRNTSHALILNQTHSVGKEARARTSYGVRIRRLCGAFRDAGTGSGGRARAPRPDEQHRLEREWLRPRRAQGRRGSAYACGGAHAPAPVTTGAASTQVLGLRFSRGGCEPVPPPTRPPRCGFGACLPPSPPDHPAARFIVSHGLLCPGGLRRCHATCSRTLPVRGQVARRHAVIRRPRRPALLGCAIRRGGEGGAGKERAARRPDEDRRSGATEYRWAKKGRDRFPGPASSMLSPMLASPNHLRFRRALGFLQH